MNETNDLTRLLRAAATDMPDNPHRAEDLARRADARHHRQVRTAVVAGVTAVAVAAVAVVFGLGLGRDSGAATVVPARSPAPTPDESRRLHLFGGVSLVPPAGWTVSYAGSSARDMWICLVPPPTETRMDWTCDGGILVESGTVVGEEGQPFQPHQHMGWYPGTGQAPCPTPPADGANGMVNEVWPGGLEPDSPSLVDQGDQDYEVVNGRSFATDQWNAHCDNGFVFHPRSWYLAEVPFRVLDYLGHPQADEDLLRSIRIGPDESRRMTFQGGVSLIPPKGWTVFSQGADLSGGPGAPRDRWACLVPGQLDRRMYNLACPGILIEAGSVAGHAGQPFEAHQDEGWNSGPDSQGCARPNGASGGSAVAPGSPGDTRPDPAAPVEQGPWNVASQVGAYDKWTAHCVDDGYVFHPRSWYLPGIPFRILDGGIPSEVAKLLPTIRIS
ncbi:MULTISPECIES: hypothetical protein [Pseudofrankia]|uniref:hypothetical protein n=1 Tax=Pseudofrankia TaxID=2994363 RepID=UPI000234C542|nr:MULTISPECIES: hypothetical protein [Pseudofrankia]OHV36432.1 hypothetical protein BCD49_19495 [Pseudofrankia sp. EUN1h]